MTRSLVRFEKIVKNRKMSKKVIFEKIVKIIEGDFLKKS